MKYEIYDVNFYVFDDIMCVVVVHSLMVRSAYVGQTGLEIQWSAAHVATVAA